MKTLFDKTAKKKLNKIEKQPTYKDQYASLYEKTTYGRGAKPRGSLLKKGK